MSSNKINSTTNRVMLKTVGAALQNFQLINGISSIVNANAKIEDLLIADNLSDTQTLLDGCKTIFDYAIARGLASVSVIQVGQFDSSGNPVVNGGYDNNGNAQVGSVKFNYDQYYSTTPSSTSSLTIYQIDLSYFFEYDATSDNNYTKKLNVDLYDNGNISNGSYISEVNDVISSMEQCTNLINDVMSSL